MKTAQDMSSFDGRTLNDLYAAIQDDAGLQAFQKIQLMAQIQGMTMGVSPSTQLSSLIRRGLGGILGMLIAKYFGMGGTGQALSALGGFGLGAVLDQHLNRPPDPFPGWKRLG